MQRGRGGEGARSTARSPSGGSNHDGEEAPKLDAEVAALVRNGPFESTILETSPADFDAAKLVETLTSPYIADAGTGSVALDPQALRKLFTTVQVMLAGMAQDAEQAAAELERDAEPVEDDYRQGLAQHASTLELLSSNLAKVDTRFRKVTAEAVRTGDSLGKKEAQRLRAANAIELLEYFKVFDELPDGFAADQGSVLRNIRALPLVFSDEDRRAEAAQVLARLRAVTFELEAPGLDRAAGNMRAYSDFLEQELLDLFERAASRQPPEADFMQECAEILYTLNEGDHLQGRYVFHVVSRRLGHGASVTAAAAAGGGAAGTAAGAGNSSGRNASFSSSSEGQDQHSLSGLFGRVVEVCRTEFPVIATVFPPLLAPKVTRLLLQRILTDPVYGVQARVEQVLSPAPPLEPLPLPDYLNCLCMVEQQTMALFDMLKAHNTLLEGSEKKDPAKDGAAVIPPVWEESELAHPSTTGGSSSSGTNSRKGQAAALRNYLDDQARHMFYEHRAAYPAKEQRNLLASLLQLSEGAWPGALEFKPIPKHTAITSLDSFPSVYLEKVVSYEQLLSGPLRAGAVRDVLDLSTEAVHRCRSIEHEEEDREQRVSVLWTIVCNYMIGHLVLPALKAAVQLLPSPSQSTTATAIKEMRGDMSPVVPPRQFYEAVAAATGASAALAEHHRSVIAPGMEAFQTLRTIARETRRSHMQQVEAAASRGLQKALELLAAGAERLFSARKAKDDYSVRDDSTAAMDASKTVKLLCALLRDQHAVATHCLPTTDLTSLWSAVGLCALKLFADHLKRSRVTIAGAFILANDINSLQGALSSYGAPKVAAALEDLREISNLYLVPPANLPGLMETGRLAAMSRTELREFVRQRSDFTTSSGAKAAWAKELFGAEETAPRDSSPGPSVSTGRLKERLPTLRLLS